MHQLMPRQEKLEGVIELPESSEVIKSMLSFLYRSKYDAMDQARPLQHNVQVYIAADKYDIPTLKTLAQTKVTAWLTLFESSVQAAHRDPACPAPRVDILHFLDMVALVYSGTHTDTDIFRLTFIACAKRIFPLQHAANLEDDWKLCFERAPSFAYEWLKPVVLQGELGWEAFAPDVTLDCSRCDTWITMSLNGVPRPATQLTMESKCPNHEFCGGLLDGNV